MKEAVEKLEGFLDTDQQDIKLFKAGSITLDEIAQRNDLRKRELKNIIKEFGFPYKNKFSEKAYTAAFLIIQHSGDIKLIDETIENWAKCSEEQVNRGHLAYLIDRSLVLKNLPQRFGTQYKIEDGENILCELEREIISSDFSCRQKLCDLWLFTRCSFSTIGGTKVSLQTSPASINDTTELF
jgi:translation initiation factor IF-2